MCPILAKEHKRHLLSGEDALHLLGLTLDSNISSRRRPHDAWRGVTRPRCINIHDSMSRDAHNTPRLLQLLVIIFRIWLIVLKKIYIQRTHF